MPLYSARSDHSESDKLSLAVAIAQKYDVKRLGNATSKYNCHSYAWYFTSSQNTSFVAHPGRYFNDPHAIRATTAGQGDIVVYFDETGKSIHSAVISAVSGNSITCQSKWGANGLFEHRLTQVPGDYCGSDGQIRYAILSYLRAHNYVATVIDTAYHRLTCKFCDLNVTEAHTADSRTGKCITCGSVVSSTIFRAVLPESPDTEPCEHHR